MLKKTTVVGYRGSEMAGKSGHSSEDRTLVRHSEQLPKRLIAICNVASKGQMIKGREDDL